MKSGNEHIIDFDKLDKKMQRRFQQIFHARPNKPPPIRIVLPLNYDENLRDVWESKK